MSKKPSGNAFGLDTSFFVGDSALKDAEDKVKAEQSKLMSEGDMKRLIAGALADVNVDNIELTEDDLNDPSLLGELDELMGTPTPKPQTSTPKVAPKVQNAPLVEEKQPQAVDNAKKLEDANARLLAMKKESLALNKAGKRQEALEVFQRTKKLEKYIKSLENQVASSPKPQPAPTVQPPARQGNVGQPFQQSSIPSATKPLTKPIHVPVPVVSPKQGRTMNVSPSQEPPQKRQRLTEDTAPPVQNSMIPIIQERMDEFQNKAVHLYSNGHKQLGIEYFKYKKQLQVLLDRAIAGEEITMKDLPPTVKELEEQELESLIDGGDIPIPEVGNKNVKEFNELRAALNKQREAAHESALNFLRKNDKTKAKQWLGQRKLHEMNLENLEAAHALPGSPLPRYRWDVSERKVVVMEKDLSPHEVELSVLYAKFLKLPKGETTAETYVTADLNFHNDFQYQLKTNTIKSDHSPAYGYTKKYQCDKRRQKSFAQRKKIIFEIYTAKGWLWKSAVLLGKAECRPTGLLTEPSVTLKLPVMAGRKHTGGFLFVKLRIQQPADKQNVKIIKTKTLVIEERVDLTKYQQQQKQPVATLRPTQPAPQRPTPQRKPTPVQAPPARVPPKKVETKPAQTPVNKPTPKKAAPPKQTPTQPQKAVVKPVSAPVAPGTPKAPAGKKVLPYTSIDRLVSNAVLEYESATLAAKIVKAKREKKPTDDLEIKKQQIDFKCQFLIVQVQTGALTEDGYVNMINEAIAEEKRYAQIFQKEGKTALLKLALHRIDLMDKELKGEA